MHSSKPPRFRRATLESLCQGIQRESFGRSRSGWPVKTSYCKPLVAIFSQTTTMRPNSRQLC
eukprot:2223550-Amphidinium_carterae.1